MKTTMTTRIWTGGEGMGRGREKNDGITTIVHDISNIRVYLTAMMTGVTTTRTFPSSWRWISKKATDHFLALAVLPLAFLSSSSSLLLSRVVAVVAG